MNIRLEHANICVHDINGMIEFLRTAFPEFKIRYDGIGSDGVRWVVPSENRIQPIYKINNLKNTAHL